VIPEMRVERALVNGEPVGNLRISVRDEQLGWFAIDNNENLWDKNLPQFVLEFRDESRWEQLDPIAKRSDPLKGWQRVSPRRLLKILQMTGHIDIDELREG
jgi:hypothetical protein